MKKTALRRGPGLRKRGARKLRRLPAEIEFQRNPPERCARCWKSTPPWWTSAKPWIVGHHRLRKGQGGLHEPENRAWLCRPCHGLIHDHNVLDWAGWFGPVIENPQPPIELWDPR